jgi:CubicO group peptidase (beta-lactamase class C family)
MRKKMTKPALLRLFATFVFLILIVSCSTEKKIEVMNYKGIVVPTDSIDSYFESRMKELNIPGLSFAIINDGEVVYHNVMGFANLEEKIPVTNKTIFEGASMSKSLFAFFVMTFVEEGKLDLDKPLFEYLPYPDIAYDDRYKKITARIVLSHRSGFPNWRENEADKRLKIRFEPGTEYEYSGEGYQYLAMVLKKIEGTDWNGVEKAFQEKVAKPIGLEHTVFIQTPFTKEHKAEPYDRNGKWIDWKNGDWYKKSENILVAAASIHSEPIDFAKWMITVMKGEILSDESYNELFKHHSQVSNSGHEVFYSLGFFTLGKPLNNLYLHPGDNDGFTCYYALDIEKDWGYVLFTNSQNGGGLGGDFSGFLDKEKY